MEQYYSQQAVLPRFTGDARQRGIGFGSLAAGVGRVAVPFSKKILLPAVESLGKELFVQSLPELVEVATKRNSVKQAAKSAVRKTVKKQVGGSAKEKLKLVIKRKKLSRRSRSDFFSRGKNVA